MDTRIRPWEDTDLPLLFRANEPAMTAYLGGPEADERVVERHGKYLRYVREEQAGIFAIEVDGVAVGGVNWWQSHWHGEDTLEIGWFVVPEAQGRGVAAAGVALALDDARLRADRRRILAFPSVENPASNRLCARLGFTHLGDEPLVYRDASFSAAVWTMDLDERPVDPRSAS